MSNFDAEHPRHSSGKFAAKHGTVPEVSLGDDEPTPLPDRWRTHPDGAVVCPHRDLSVCRDCEAAHPHVVEAAGAHYWCDTVAEASALRAELAELLRDVPKT